MADEVRVEFDSAIHSVDAIRAAAYRVMDAASCNIETSGPKVVCHLIPKSGVKQDGETLRLRFMDLVTDESLRAQLSKETEPVRNLILSLAFGSLATQPTKTE